VRNLKNPLRPPYSVFGGVGGKGREPMGTAPNESCGTRLNLAVSVMARYVGVIPVGQGSSQFEQRLMLAYLSTSLGDKVDGDIDDNHPV
jgi:hypothetical protein